MRWYVSILFFASMLSFFEQDKNRPNMESNVNVKKNIHDISLPAGYQRIYGDQNSFTAWLRNVSLKADKTVYLYNGKPKSNQNAQFAVLDIPIGNKDLQQCADAVIRLRASYLFDRKRMKDIVFYDNNSKAYTYSGKDDFQCFVKYLETVFAYCGTASLEKQLKRKQIKDILPGDVFVKGGFPGHAIMVMDVAVNSKGEKIYLLAQSYMPAQDIHVLNNPQNSALSPWYIVNDGQVVTPEWTFQSTQLFGW